MSGVAFTNHTTLYSEHPTNADFSGKSGFGVKFISGTDMDLCGAGELADGVLPDSVRDWSSEPNRTGNPVQSVIVSGAGMGLCGTTISGTGKESGGLKLDAAGEWIPGTTGDTCSAYALETAANGDQFRLYMETFVFP